MVLFRTVNKEVVMVMVMILVSVVFSSVRVVVVVVFSGSDFQRNYVLPCGCGDGNRIAVVNGDSISNCGDRNP